MIFEGKLLKYLAAHGNLYTYLIDAANKLVNPPEREFSLHRWNWIFYNVTKYRMLNPYCLLFSCFPGSIRIAFGHKKWTSDARAFKYFPYIGGEKNILEFLCNENSWFEKQLQVQAGIEILCAFFPKGS